MIPISVSIEGWFGLTWPQWRHLAAEVQRLGLDGLFLSDHFQISTTNSPPQPSLELIVALTCLASHSERIHFGAMVSPLSVRDPVLLARQAMAIDDLSGGRLIVGVGAGWNQAEHAMFGYPLGDVPTRIARFAEGLEVITRLLRGDGPVSLEGRFFQLREALLLPRPQRAGGPPIMIGGSGPRYILPLVARYADRWDAGFLSLAAFHERAGQLDALLLQAGRRPSDVWRGLTAPIFCYRDHDELEQRLRGARHEGQYGTMPAEAMLGQLRSQMAAISGSPAEVAAQIDAYIAAGIDELVIQWYDSDDIEGLQIIVDEVLPRVQSSRTV